MPKRGKRGRKSVAEKILEKIKKINIKDDDKLYVITYDTVKPPPEFYHNVERLRKVFNIDRVQRSVYEVRGLRGVVAMNMLSRHYRIMALKVYRVSGVVNIKI